MTKIILFVTKDCREIKIRTILKISVNEIAVSYKTEYNRRDFYADYKSDVSLNSSKEWNFFTAEYFIGYYE